MLKLYRADLTPAAFAAGEAPLLSLPDALEPQLSQQINGDWSLTFSHPARGLAAQQLGLDLLVLADGQLYRIQSLEKSGSGSTERLNVQALHLIYDLRSTMITNIETAETTPGGISQHIALEQILQGTPFTRGVVDTDPVLDYLDILQKDVMWALKEQVLKLWGGELVPNNWTVNIRKKMGLDRGLQLRYGKNITGVRYSQTLDGVITRLHILGYQNANIESINDGKDYIDSPHIGSYANVMEGLVTFSDDDLPEDLLRKGQEYLATVDKPKITLSVDLARVQSSQQYRHYRNLEKVGLGDTVIVYHQRLGLEIEARVQSRQMNPVSGDNLQVELGNEDRNLYSAIASMQTAAEIIQQITDRKGHLRGEQLRGMVDLLTTKLYASGSYQHAQVNDKHGLLFENIDSRSVDYGAMYIGPGIFAIASEKDETGLWIWRTFGTGRGFVGQELLAESVKTEQLSSEVGGSLDISSNQSITSLAGEVGEKNKTSLGEEAPASPSVGDLWIDSANQNLLKRWDGTAWASVQDGAISLAQQTANQIQWIIASGTEASNMVLTEKLYQLVTNKVMIEADKEIKLQVAQVKIGGTNLINNSDFSLGLWPATVWATTSSMGTYNDKPMLQLATASGQSYGYVYAEAKVEAGQPLSLSFVFDGVTSSRFGPAIWPDGSTVVQVSFRDASGNAISAVQVTAGSLRDEYADYGPRRYNRFLGETPSNAASAHVRLHVIGSNNAGVRYAEVKLEHGTKASAWSPSPSDPAVALHASGVEIGPDFVRTHSTGVIEGRGAQVLFDTPDFQISNAGEPVMAVQSSGVTVDAEVLQASKIRGDVVNAFSGGAIPWRGGINASLSGTPKYLIGDAVLNIPAGTYTENVVIRGFVGGRLTINLASGTIIRGNVTIWNCQNVVIDGASRDTVKIQPVNGGGSVVGAYYTNYLSITNLGLRGFAGRTTSANGSLWGVYAQASYIYVGTCLIDKVQDGLTCSRGGRAHLFNCIGGVGGSSDPTGLAITRYNVRVLELSHAAIAGTTMVSVAGENVGHGEIYGTGTPTATPGTQPPPPVETTSVYNSTAAYRIAFPDTTPGERWSALDPQQGKYSSTDRFGIWVLPAIDRSKTIKSARLTVERAMAYGVDPVSIFLFMHGQSSINTLTYYQKGTILGWFTNTGHVASMSRGDSMVFDLNASTISALQSGACRGFGVGTFSSNYSFAQMKPVISLEITYTS